jgi:hypothetical protein
MTELNDEDEGTAISHGTTSKEYRLFLIFPELREFDGLFASHKEDGGNIKELDTSGDTTNGIDGTFTQRNADLPDPPDTLPSYRSATYLLSYAVSNVRAIRLRTDNTNNTPGWRAVHVYGEISAGETPDRLLFLDADNADVEFSKPIDYGDVPRGQSQDRNIKIINNSGTLTANTVQLTAEALYLGSGAWYTFSDDGGSNFSATLNIGNLGPGATSTIIIRQIVPATETLSLHAGRVKANTASWS